MNAPDYNNGTVLDTKTSLMWAARDNGSDIDWEDAKSYCENYQGGDYTDWRMPTIIELKNIYDENKENRHGYHVTRLIDITSCCPWSSETEAGSQAANLGFSLGKRRVDHQSRSVSHRALPVRSSK